MAYINVDISVFGRGGSASYGGLEKGGAGSEQVSLIPPTANATLRAQGTPPVQSVIFSATKEVWGRGDDPVG